MEIKELKEAVKKVISGRVGRESAVTAAELAASFGFDDDRPVRKAIEGLIRDEFPICSVTEPPAGYFFPASVEEARIYTKSLQHRAAKIFLRRRHIVRNTARHYERARQEKFQVNADGQVAMRL